MIVDKCEMLAIHEGEFEAWERLRARLSPAQLTDPSLPARLSVKDTLAHLGAWQGRTIARLEAALYGHEPRLPTWSMGLSNEETSDEVDRANAWILETNRTCRGKQSSRSGERASCACLSCFDRFPRPICALVES